MDKKLTKFKLIRFLFYFLGFPALCLVCFKFLLPTITEPAMQKYGLICAIAPFAIWGIVELTRLALKRLSKKGSMQRDLATFILVIVSVALILVPMVSTDYALSSKYNKLRKEAETKEVFNYTITDPITNEVIPCSKVIYNGVYLPDYKKIMGWAIDSTNKNSSYFHGYISDINSYISTMGLKGLETSRYGHAEAKKVDYDANYDGVVDDKDYIMLGETLGYYDSLEQQANAKYNYSKIAAVLNSEYAPLVDGQKALLKLVTDKANEIVTAQQENPVDEIKLNQLKNELVVLQKNYDDFNDKYAIKIQELGGQRIHLTEDVIFAVVDILANASVILPDGLDINIIGMNLPVGDIVAFLGNLLDLLAGININDTNAVKAIVDLVLTSQKEVDGKTVKYIEISTGFAKGNQYQTCATAASKVVTDNYSYEQIRERQYKAEIYPQLLTFARLRRVMYIFAGIIILSILLSDHYSRKIDFIKEMQFKQKVDEAVKTKLAEGGNNNEN